MQAYILRQPADGSTEGFFLLYQNRKCLMAASTLELPWQDNKTQISCIPEGSYQVVPHDSPHLGKCFKIMNVPGRSEILIHAGNTIADTKGCVLIGEWFVKNQIIRSQANLEKLMKLAPKGFQLIVKKL